MTTTHMEKEGAFALTDDFEGAFALTLGLPGVEVIRIERDGSLYWHGREVTTDDDFKAAMLSLARHLCGDFRP